MIDFIPQETIMHKIMILRGEKVMLDRDLALLYGVETKRLNEAVKRNMDRFPADFMFQLNEKEFENLRSQFATSSWGGQRYAPYAFTEHGILMLSSVLRSAQAIQTNISIIRVFNHMRKMIDTNTKMMEKLNKIERGVLENNQEIQELRFEIKKMMSVEVDDNERTIGFRLPTQDS